MKLTIENIGPVTKLSLKIPETGGLIVLRGSHGTGKSTCLAAIDRAVSGRGNISVRDGATNGKVEAFGITMRVGRTVKATGELEVQSLDGRLQVSDLIDPGLKSAGAADAKRIKALVQLSGTDAAPSLFYELAGGREKFEAIVRPSSLDGKDLVAMAEAIKRDFEAEARKQEGQAEHASGRARGAKEAAAGVDANLPSDSAALGDELEKAIAAEAGLKAKAKAAVDAARSNEAAEDALAAAQAKYTGPTIEAAAAREKTTADALKTAQVRVNEAEFALRQAREEYTAAFNAADTAIASRRSAEQHASTIAQWTAQVAMAIPPKIPQSDLDQAASRVLQARTAVEQGALVRKAKDSLKAAESANLEASGHIAAAESLRNAAKSTDEVLSGVVQKLGCPLRVEAGRLVTDTKRGATFFSELSDGERVDMAFDIAIKAVGSGGMLTIEQRYFGELQPSVRKQIAAKLAGSGVVALTALATDDPELTAEVLEA